MKDLCTTSRIRILLYSVVTLFMIEMVCSPLTTHAQPISAKTFFTNVGFVAGTNWSFLHGAPSVDNGPTSTRSIKHGFLLGIAGTHQISQRLNLDILALYELKGSKVDIVGTQTQFL